MNIYYEWKCPMCHRSTWSKQSSANCFVDGTIMVKQENGDKLVQIDSENSTKESLTDSCCEMPLEEIKDSCVNCKENLNLHLNAENN